MRDETISNVKSVTINDILDADKKVKKKYIHQCALVLSLVCVLTPQAGILVVIQVELNPEDKDYYEQLEKQCEIFWDKINPANDNQIDLTEDTWKE